MDMMIKNLEKVLSSSLFLDRYLYFLFQENGKIIRWLNRPGPNYTQIRKEILNAGGVAEFYPLEGRLQKPAVQTTFLQSKRFQWHPYASEFYTTLPMTSLQIESIGRDRFLGRISFNDFMPNIFTKTITGIIFADQCDDRLLGFSAHFLELLGGDPEKPGTLLEKPLSLFLSPTPVEYQRRKLESPDLSKLVPANRKIQTFSSPSFSFAAPGWNADIFTLPGDHDTLKEDFALSVFFRNIGGYGPCCILGEPPQKGDEGLDVNGYLMGREDTGGKPVIKRMTYITAVEDNPRALPGADRESVLRFCKIGNRLIVAQDNEIQVAYYDGDFLHRRDARLSLSLRQQYRCDIREVTLEYWTPGSPASAEPERQAASFISKPERYFSLDRFYNYRLSTPDFYQIGRAHV
jgi:hypothetical protein